MLLVKASSDYVKFSFHAIRMMSALWKSRQKTIIQNCKMPILILYNRFKCWGWASWARAWKHMDMSMSKWPEQSLFKLIRPFGIFKGCMMYYYWNRTYKNIHKCTSWATRWAFAILQKRTLYYTRRQFGFEHRNGWRCAL